MKRILHVGKKMKSPEELKEDFTEHCTACGACAAMCPALATSSLDETSSAIQEQLKEFLKGGPPTGIVIERAQLCNECYQCTVDTCPVGLDPMRTNLVLRGCLRDQGAWQGVEFIPPSDPAADQRVLATFLTTQDEFRRITTPFKKGDGRYLFFPGCNIYNMPDKLLTAMDIMDRLTENWAYLPGLTHCCGGNHSTAGDLDAGLTAMKGLVDAFHADAFEMIVLWCPTCVTLFHLSEVNLPTIPFARFVADRLPGNANVQDDTGPITLHDPCKNLFLGIDPEAPRDLLAQVTGESVLEMPRKNYCCGHGLLAGSPDKSRRWIESRLEEASDTGAGTMVNICHGCHWLFTGPEWRTEIKVANYVTLVGRYLGINHEERYLKWRKWNDPERVLRYIWSDVGERIELLPFSRKQIEKMIRRIFHPGGDESASG